MHFTCRSFIGHPNPSNWSQYWENEPDDRGLLSTHGHLFGLVNLICSTHPDISLLGHDLINDINTAYYSDINHDLRLAITTIVEKAEYKNANLSIIIVVIVNNRFNLLVFNSGEIILRRGDHISHLLSGQEGGFVSLAGPVVPEDQLFLTTVDFFNSLSWIKTKSYLSGIKVQDIEENFLAHLYSLDDQSSTAGAYIQVHSDEPIITISPSPSTPPVSYTSIISRLMPKSGPTFVSHQDSATNQKRHKINIFISIILILCLCFSSVYGYRQNQKRQTEVNYQQFKTELDKQLSNAQALKNLNLDTALAQAKESQAILVKMSALKVHSDEVSQYQQKVSGLLSQTGSVDNFSPTVFYDTSLIINQPHFSQLVLVKNLLYLLNPTSGRIDEVNISQKSTKNISQTDDLKNSQFMAEDNDIVYVLKGSDIYSVGKSSLTSKIKITDSVKNFTSGQFGFWNSGIYLLSTIDATLWRFAPNSTGFTAGQLWLKDNQRLPASPTALAINGNIWVIGVNGALIPYAHGAKVDFKPSSSPTVTAAANLTTSIDSNLIAFSDSNSSIYVFKKTGETVAHFNLGNRQISSLAIDPASNSIFTLCTDQKIYKISL